MRCLEHVWIPLADGTRLAARIWLPADAEANPVPAILEYLPYRKGDATAIDDSTRHPYFAARGYAAVRVDIRGTGDSDGLLTDEYTRQEHDDALEVLRWIAAQPWCTGSIGMMGISWGGFNSLQVAARRPPELKAIITCCSTDDRYADDVHYMGGCVLAFYLSVWATVMYAQNVRPPDPAAVGEGWRATWLRRLEEAPFLAGRWLEHQRRDAYWKHGSVCEDYAAIECPVYAVGGWSDGYTDAVLRLLEGLSCPRKGLIGPWEHVWPEVGVPGPAIGFLQESLRWWDRWLKDIDTGVMDEPALRFWMQDSVEPRPWYEHRAGRWAAEDAWPSPRIDPRPLPLESFGLERPVAHSSRQSVGVDAGSWLPYANPADLPGDQGADDAGSLCLDSAPLAEPLELLGCPEVQLLVESDRPVAFVAVRLCDLRPDGSSALITRGVLNLCHRTSHEHPQPMPVGEPVEVTVPLKAIAYSLPRGHRLRVAVSTSYWPWIWPSPERVTIVLHPADRAELRLPVRPARDADAALAPFASPESSPAIAYTDLAEQRPYVVVSRDVGAGSVEYRMSRALWGAKRFADGLVMRDRDPIRFLVTDDDPLSCRVEMERTIEIERGDWRTRIEVRTEMTADRDRFLVTGRLDAFEGDTRVFGRVDRAELPRDHQ